MKDKYKDAIIDTLTNILESIDILIVDSMENPDKYDSFNNGYLKALEDIKSIVVDELHDITG